MIILQCENVQIKFPNLLKKVETRDILIVFNGVFYHVCAYTVTSSYRRST
jgi:hypothetical protein